MAIPPFQDIMLPFLKITQDGNQHSLSEMVDILAKSFALTTSEQEELLASGRQGRFENRVAWVRTHLGKAGLVEKTERGKFRITERGLSTLKSNPTRIDLKYLMQFPEYADFRNPLRPDGNKQDEREEHSLTAEETLEGSYQSIRKTLAEDLLDFIKQCSPRFFERLVVDLLLALGYGGSRKDAGQAIGRSGDGGIDGIIKEDRLGLDVVYIQAKRWDGIVGRPIIQGFAGSLEGQRARKGVFITTSRFSNEARDYVTHIEKKIILIDGEQLVQYMIDYGVGVAEVATYTIKRIDLDYFSDA